MTDPDVTALETLAGFLGARLDGVGRLAQSGLLAGLPRRPVAPVRASSSVPPVLPVLGHLADAVAVARSTLPREVGDALATAALGMLLLGPGVDYPHHHHRADEVYLPLTTARWSHGAGAAARRGARRCAAPPPTVAGARHDHGRRAAARALPLDRRRHQTVGLVLTSSAPGVDDVRDTLSPCKGGGVLVPWPRRSPADPRGLQLFVHLARIAATTADVDGPARADLRHDLHLLELESARERPRHEVELALVDEVVTGLAGVVSASTLALLADVRDDVRRPHPDLRPVDGLAGPAGVPAAG